MGRQHELHMISLITPSQSALSGELEGLHEPAQLILCRHNYRLHKRLMEALHPLQWRRTLRRILDRKAGLPRSVAKLYVPELEDRLKAILIEKQFDAVQLIFKFRNGTNPTFNRHTCDSKCNETSD